MAAERTGSSPGTRARIGSVRLRTTVGAVLVVAAALIAGSVALVMLLGRTLAHDVQAAAELRADEISLVLEAADDPGALVAADVEEQLIQVLDDSGAVVMSSANVHGRPPVAALGPGESATLDNLVDDASFLAVAVGADTAAGDYVVIVARSLDDADEAVQTVTGLLAAGLPLLLLVVGGTAWRVVGRALAPVDAIRHEVEEISGTQLHRRVPQPPGKDEIGRLARTMNAMLGRLDGAATRQRRFLSDASHELRSPVASIRQHSEVALAYPDRTTVAALAETVLAEDLRMQRLVEGLLLLARSDEGTLPASSVPVDLDDVVFAHARRVRAPGLHVDTADVSGGRVLGVPGQLDQMLANLLDNAVRHAQELITVSLRTDIDQGNVVLRIGDDGAGIPVEDRERVFERFVRLDEARARDGGGSGLGLAIVAEVVRSHGGTISVTDAPGGGARFEVRLPLQD